MKLISKHHMMNTKNKYVSFLAKNVFKSVVLRQLHIYLQWMIKIPPGYHHWNFSALTLAYLKLFHWRYSCEGINQMILSTVILCLSYQKETVLNFTWLALDHESNSFSTICDIIFFNSRCCKWWLFYIFWYVQFLYHILIWFMNQVLIQQMMKLNKLSKTTS